MAKQKILEPWGVIKNLFDEYQIPVNQAASDLQLSPSAIRQTLSGKTKISPQVALRLGKYFNLTGEYWLTLQNQYDLAEAQKDSELSNIVKTIPKAQKPKAGAKKSEAPKAAAKGKAKAPVGKGVKAKADVKPAKAPKKSAPKAAKPKKVVK
jgi:addiction module HigA family antidote